MQIEQISIALRTAFARRRLYNKIADELSAYTDRELADLGLSRYDIPTLARQGAYPAVENPPAATVQHDLHFARAA
ncbi:DUF1127 domain-containing protein [Ancylobacter lacus]|uniref:DUF1127 domain-containing protein n=1 Tax=Ancylobacter lacus TaxID=2579970 RepID=UPI001BCF18F2|nr:DUF1127 domain-containing protein [Ancylobacter lacus]MBS7541196.1 DUF1127 domain-containing protein [Ancylobacter lacus]